MLASVSGTTAAVITEMAYPICDLLLAALVVGVLALRGWRIDRVWALLGGGFLALTVADCMYALQVAGGASAPSATTNLAYDVGVPLLALAAWQPAETLRGRQPRRATPCSACPPASPSGAGAARVRPLQPPRPAGAWRWR